MIDVNASIVIGCAFPTMKVESVFSAGSSLGSNSSKNTTPSSDVENVIVNSSIGMRCRKIH